MSDEMNLPAIEERLQAEARRLLTQEHGLSASRLADVYRRRQRRRRAAQAAAGATVLLIALAVRSGGPRAERAAAPRGATVAKLEHGPAARGPSRTNVPAARQKPAVATQTEDTLFAIPFVIGNPEADEEVITGIYVPEQVEPIDLGDLSPAELDAVRAVLGAEGEDADVIQTI